MSLRAYLILLGSAAALSASAWVFVLFNVDPQTTNNVGLALFYLTLLLAVAGTASLLGFVVRFAWLHQRMAGRIMLNALRQGFLLATLAVTILFFLASHWFSWLNIALLFIAISVLEFFLLGYQKERLEPLDYDSGDDEFREF